LILNNADLTIINIPLFYSFVNLSENWFMKYMGSKARFAKELLPIILKDRKPDQWYVEPFVGGANMIDKVGGKRIGADVSPYLIDALIAIRDYVDKLPKNNKEFTESDYMALRSSDNCKFKGYAGFAFSYGGKWLGGWCRDGMGKRDYVSEAYRNAAIQSDKLKGVILVNESYLKLQIPHNSIIYCDPPYRGTTKYKDGFDHDVFWKWCIDKHREGHTVFVSEYDAPDAFACVWKKETTSSLTKDTGSKRAVEKLFKYKP
jgi:DNA adenine methylase